MSGKKNLIVPSSELAREYGRRGGYAKAQSQRHKRKLSERIKLALEISTKENLKALKRQIKEIWSNRQIPDIKEQLRLKLAQAKTIKECGFELYMLLRIKENPMTDNKDKIKIIDMLWDREEGKPIQKQQIEGEIKEKRIYIEKEEKKNYEEHIKNIVNDD